MPNSSFNRVVTGRNKKHPHRVGGDEQHHGGAADAGEEQRQRRQAEAIKFSEMDAKYDGPVTDLPSTTTAIMLDGKRKEVYRRFDYPKRILTLEQCFDDLIQSEKWISPTGETYPIER